MTAACRRWAEGYRGALLEVVGGIRLEPLVECAERIRAVWQAGGTLFVAGNGGSASTSSHVACDLVRRGAEAGDAPRVISLAESTATLTAIANDDCFEQVYAAQLRLLARPGDALLCISCSGRSPNVVAAIAEAGRLQLTVLGWGGLSGPMAAACDCYVHVPSADYGLVESAHLWLGHCLAELLAGADA